MLLKSTEKPPLLRNASCAQDFASPADIYLVEASDLAETDMLLTVRSARKRRQKPILLMTDACEVTRCQELFGRSQDVHIVVKPFSNKTLWNRAERIYRDQQDHNIQGKKPVATSSPLSPRINTQPIASIEEQLAIVLSTAENHNTDVSLLIVAPQIPAHLNANPQGFQKFSFDFKNKLQALVRDSDSIGQIDGTQADTPQVLNIHDGRFLLIFTGHQLSDIGHKIARRLHRQISSPITIDGVDTLTAPRIGLSTFPSDALETQALLDCATLATNYAHREGLCPIQRYRPCMRTEIEDQATLEVHLRRAIESNAFELVYQPKVTIHNQHCTGFEALIRWHDPELGAISPVTFIPLAERLGLITDITEWVIEGVCQQLATWRTNNSRPLKVSLNLSGQDLQSEELAGVITQNLEKWQIPPALLEVEITEGVLIENFDLSCQMLNRLRDIGVSIALDDFGTGYSSLNYLNRMPINTLKLDRSFIQDIRDDWSSAAITSCVITLAQTLGLNVIAEGVETQAQLEILKEHECNEVQGRLFSMPIDAEQATAWLTSQPA